MDQPLVAIFPFYGIALVLLVGLVIEAIATYKKQAWSIPALAVYGTTFVWYFVELVYTPDAVQAFSQDILETCYLQIVMFLGCFRLLVSRLSDCLTRHARPGKNLFAFDPARLLIVLTFIWMGRSLFDISSTHSPIVSALFRIASQSEEQLGGPALFGGTSSTGVAVTIVDYSYLLLCSCLGVLLPLQTKPLSKGLNGLLFLISLLPYVVLGSCSQLLAVVFPAYFSYVLFSRHQIWVKLLVTTSVLLVLNQVLLLLLTRFNSGVTGLIDGSLLEDTLLLGRRHLGFNMLEELCYSNSFYQAGLLQLSYGRQYLADLAPAISHVIWPDKPLIGFDYALLRGAGTSNDTGVAPSIATGFLGQGVVSFGSFFGAIAPACLLAVWTAFLSRWWVQSQSSLRLCLFLAALGVTFNLGRGITLLALLPIVLGYGLVRVVETLGKRRSPRILPAEPKQNAPWRS